MAQARGRAGLRPPAQRAAAALLAAAGVFAACSGARVGGVVLAERFPALARYEGNRLADIHPFVLPAAGQVTLFLCRWTEEQIIPVALPAGATPPERQALEAALTAWQEAGLGLRFAVVPEDAEASLHIALEDGAVLTGAGEDTANTVADCRIDPLDEQGDGAIVRGAAMVSARIRIARQSNADWTGKPRPLTPAEIAGAALHELGHALGFAGHARQGDTVMVSEVERIARAGKALLAGTRLEDATMRALYHLPSGAVIARTPTDAWRTDLVDRMARLAEREALEGPFARVGEVAGRLFWRDEHGDEYGFALLKLADTFRDPAQALAFPERRTRQALPRSLDREP